MNSFYGGKQGRTYHLVERYDQIYINQLDFNSFIDGNIYTIGDKFTWQSQVYKVLVQQDSTGQVIEEVQLHIADLTDETKVIKIKGMVNEFQKGGAYTDANYGQYVIIDTILNENHKNDDINGLIYRRGFDYTEPAISYKRPTKNDQQVRTIIYEGHEWTGRLNVFHDYILKEDSGTWVPDDLGFNDDRWTAAWRRYVLKPGGGAIYVGQIVGPQGDTPELRGMSWEEYIEYFEKAGDNIPKGIVEVSKTLGWDDEEKKYHDIIQLGYCNIKDKDDNLIGCYISFDIPKKVIKVSAQSVDPYGNTPRNHYDKASKKTDENIRITATQDPVTKKWKYENLIHEHTQSGLQAGHPFYENFDIAIPKGIHGTDLDIIKHETVDEINEQLPIEEQITIDNVSVFNGDKYITYYIKDYQDKEEGIQSKPLGRWPYRVINNITTIFKEDRKLFMSSIDQWRSEEAILGDLVKIYNKNQPDLTQEEREKYIICIQTGRTDSAQPFIPNPEERFPSFGEQFISNNTKWRVIRIPQIGSIESLEINYTAGPTSSHPTRLVDYLWMDDTGNLYVTYSDSDISYYLSSMRSIKETELRNSKLYIWYNDGSIEQFNLKQIQQIKFKDQDLRNAQKFTVTYEGGDEEEVSNGMNIVLSVQKQGDNVIVLYSDPGYREEISLYKDPSLPEPQKSEDINKAVLGKDYYILPYTDKYGRTYNDESSEHPGYFGLVWKNLGPLGAQYHVQGHYTIDNLKNELKNGFIGDLEDRAGWLVSITYEGNITLWAYDYNDKTSEGAHLLPDGTASHWYKIQDLSTSSIDPGLSVRLSSKNNSQPNFQQDELNPGGLWFVITGGHDIIT